MKSEFKGNFLIETLKSIPSYNFLVGDFGKEMLEKYHSIVKSDYENNSNLKVLDFIDNVVKGSNTYSIFLMNKILNEDKLRTPTPADVQKIINCNENFLKGSYVDLGLVLRTEDEPNEYLARQLGKQAKERNYKFSNENPLVFKSSDLNLILDNNSDSGLGFKIKESANPFNVSELSYKNNGKRFNTTNELGIPVFEEDGNRISYTNDGGLRRFYLDGLLYLGSDNGGLPDSGGDGRVVILGDNCRLAPKILENYIVNLKKEKYRQIAKINTKYEKALELLKS